MLEIAKVKHPGRTKSAMFNVSKRSFVTLVFGGKMNGIKKWNPPNAKINNASTVLVLNAFNMLVSLTFFNSNNLTIVG